VVSAKYQGCCILDKHFLCSLICPKVQRPSSTLHYDSRTEATENTSLVVFGGLQICGDNVIGIDELCVAGRTDGTLAFTLAGELAPIGAVNAEDMAWRNQLAARPLSFVHRIVAHQHVVTTAWSLSSFRHFSTLHRNVNSMPTGGSTNTRRCPRGGKCSSGAE